MASSPCRVGLRDLVEGGFVAGGVTEDYCNYPNPFKAGKQETTIIYDLEEDAKVTIKHI